MSPLCDFPSHFISLAKQSNIMCVHYFPSCSHFLLLIDTFSCGGETNRRKWLFENAEQTIILLTTGKNFLNLLKNQQSRHEQSYGSIDN